MKVLVTATTFPRWKDDKVPYFVYDLCQEYKRLGLEVVVLSPHYKNAKFVEIIDGLKIYRFPYFLPFNLQKIAYDGGILDNLKNSFLAKLQVPFFLLSDFIFMSIVVVKEHIDVIHSHWILSQGFIASLVRSITRRKHINTMHAGDLALLEKIPFRKIVVRFILANTDNFTVVSKHGLSRFLHLLPNDNLTHKIEIIPMGINTKLFLPHQPKSALKKKYKIKEKNIILFIGRLAEKKGVKYVIEALPQIILKMPDTKLIIAGEGPEKENLKRLAMELGVITNVEFRGFVRGIEKINLLQLSDLLIVPSIETKIGDSEGLPVVILEGLASGTVVVSSDIGGIADVIKDNFNGLLFEQKNHEQLIKKVLFQLRQENKINKFRANVEKTIKYYDWSNIGKRYADLLLS